MEDPGRAAPTLPREARHQTAPYEGATGVDQTHVAAVDSH